MVVRVDVKHIRVAKQYTRRTLGDDMQIINTEVFGRRSIAARLKERLLFGIASKTNTRAAVYAANSLVHQYTESVS